MPTFDDFNNESGQEPKVGDRVIEMQGLKKKLKGIITKIDGDLVVYDREDEQEVHTKMSWFNKFWKLL